MESSFKKEIMKDFAFWYMIVGPVIITFLAIINYNHPEFGFSGEGYGLGVVILCLFPTIWIMIYLFCKHIEFKNRQIKEMEKYILEKGGTE